MANLNNNNPLGIVEYVARKEAICANGKVLVNYGSGWKLKAKLKAGVNPAEHLRKVQEGMATKEANNPFYAQFKQLLKKTVCQKYRYRLSQAVSLMPTDPDGIWSEMDDSMHYDGGAPDLDDIAKLCQLYELSLKRAKELLQSA